MDSLAIGNEVDDLTQGTNSANAFQVIPTLKELVISSILDVFARYGNAPIDLAFRSDD
jgi:hypothetical protein